MSAYRFLVIENSEMSIKIITDILATAGWSDVCVARSSLEALTILGLVKDTEIPATEIDLVLTSLVMADLDGIELCKRIKSAPRYKNVPVVMITSSEDREVQEAAFQAGIQDYILKPFNSVFIVPRLKAALQLKDELEARRRREKKLERHNRNLVNELEIAQQLQKNLLPAALESNQVSISGCYLPIGFLGGDLYYWECLSDGKIGVVMLDVMGHGTATSMIGMYLRSILPTLLKEADNAKDFIAKLNATMLGFNEQVQQGEYYCTAFCLLLDTVNKTAEYVNAGSPPVAFFEGAKVRWLEEGCPPVGMFPQLPIKSELFRYDQGSKILIYSDGIEALFSEKRLKMEYLLNYIQMYGRKEASTAAVIEKFTDFIRAFPRDDDISFVYIDFLEEREL